MFLASYILIFPGESDLEINPLRHLLVGSKRGGNMDPRPQQAHHITPPF